MLLATGLFINKHNGVVGADPPPEYPLSASFAITSSLQPGWSVVRAGAAWFWDWPSYEILDEAAADTARFAYAVEDYPLGVADWQPIGLMFEPAATNFLTAPRDLEDASWTASDITPAQDETGIDGTALAASTLTATDADGTIKATVGSLTSARHTFSAWVKRVTGTGAVYMTIDDGTTWYEITGFLTDDTLIQRVFVSAATAATSRTVGFKIAVSGDEIIVDACQLEAAVSDGVGVQCYPTSEILTGGATRAADEVHIPVSATDELVLTAANMPAQWFARSENAIATISCVFDDPNYNVSIYTAPQMLPNAGANIDPDGDGYAYTYLIEGVAATEIPAAGYTVEAVLYGAGTDQTTDCLARSAAWGSSFGATKGIISAWVRFDSFSTTPRIVNFGSGAVGLTYLGVGTDGKINAQLIDDADETSLVFYEISVNALSIETKYHILLSVDMTQASGADRVKLYVNGTEWSFNAYTDPTQNKVINWDGLSMAIGGRPGSTSNMLNGHMTEVYCAFGYSLNEVSGATVADRLAKFIDGDSKPVDLGADGSTPTGVQPHIYIPGVASKLPSTGTLLEKLNNAAKDRNNAGSAGFFTLHTPTLEAGTWSPSD